MTNLEQDPSENTAGSSKMRKGMAAGLAGGLLAGTAAGLVFGVPGLTSAASPSVQPPSLVAQSDEEGTTDEEDTTTTDDTESSESEGSTDSEESTDSEVPAEWGDRLREALQDLVDDGTLTESQVDAVVDQLGESMPQRGGFGGFGHGGPGGGFGRFGGGPGMGAMPNLDELNELLGLDLEDIGEQLRDGSTLAEIAEGQGVDPQAVIDQMVAALQERLDEAVADGDMDQAEADEKLADATERITEMVNEGFGWPGRPGADDSTSED